MFVEHPGIHALHTLGNSGHGPRVGGDDRHLIHQQPRTTGRRVDFTFQIVIRHESATFFLVLHQADDSAATAAAEEVQAEVLVAPGSQLQAAMEFPGLQRHDSR